MTETNTTFAEINQIRIARGRFIRVMAEAVVALEAMVKEQSEELHNAIVRSALARSEKEKATEDAYKKAVSDDERNERVAYSCAYMQCWNSWKIFGGRNYDRASKYAARHIAKLKAQGSFTEAVKAHNAKYAFPFHWCDSQDDYPGPEERRLRRIQGFLEVARCAWSVAKAGVATSHLVNVVPDSVEHVIFGMQDAGSLKEFIDKEWQSLGEEA